MTGPLMSLVAWRGSDGGDLMTGPLRSLLPGRDLMIGSLKPFVCCLSPKGDLMTGPFRSLVAWRGSDNRSSEIRDSSHGVVGTSKEDVRPFLHDLGAEVGSNELLFLLVPLWSLRVLLCLRKVVGAIRIKQFRLWWLCSLFAPELQGWSLNLEASRKVSSRPHVLIGNGNEKNVQAMTCIQRMFELLSGR
ncbi:hypothetical protein CR513_49185, partial [Mucuna pruriens]